MAFPFGTASSPIAVLRGSRIIMLLSRQLWELWGLSLSDS